MPPLCTRRRWLVSAGAAPFGRALAHEARLEAPNLVPIHERLFTAGQPTAQSLSNLGALGFQAVIYLAPPTVGDAVRDEPERLARQGIDYLNIPVPFDRPAPAHFDAFAAAMARWSDRKCLVHCQINLRASSFVFVHRVTVGKEAPEAAYAAVSRVWSPDRVWRAWIVGLLRGQGIGFEPY